jgi:hypothetical protein
VLAKDLTHRLGAVVGGSRDGRRTGDEGTRARVLLPARTGVFTMLGRTVRGHRSRRVGDEAVRTRTHPGLHVRRMEPAKGLTEERRNVKREDDRRGSLKHRVRSEDHLGRREDALGNGKR